MSHTLKSYRTKTNFVADCKSMEDKLKKYFEVMPKIFIVASVMDPRIKVWGVELLLERIGQNLGITLPSTSTVTTLLTSIYASYESKFTCTTTTERSQYLEINLLTNDDLQSFDILAWWKKNEMTFPILSILARDLLTSPVSSVASESAFSIGNRVLDERTNRLAPDILDCLICLKD
ncbi:hypothetical protein RHMOL_Rhmol05G0170300 [Rhododendron molle]|uniref:Uncharacterized protein n=1 Tax=Rhododendron molle TaxID=49168 RepID=A0ACC0NRJ0_RHOML|nr:hypothetical protein RHMOL_Rhmol05G0170300 [Rhododendron molle]